MATAQSCAQATTLRGVNWDVLRIALQNERIRAGFENAAEFAAATTLAKTTVYRIEAGKVRPDLESIEQWLAASTGRTLSDFFGHLEQLSSPVTPEPDDDRRSSRSASKPPASPPESAKPLMSRLRTQIDRLQILALSRPIAALTLLELIERYLTDSGV